MPQTMGAMLLTLFGVIALGLSAVGLYGLLAYVVNQRRPELGLRLALGADQRDVLRLIVRHGAWLLAAGIYAGFVLSLWTTRLLERFLFGLAPYDPATHALAVLVLAGTGFLACYVPARRASRIDPMIALRHE